MDVKAPDEGQYRFGPYLLDPAERSLTRDGTPVEITYRVFEMLLAFVRSPGRLLTKDELLEAVWPGRFMEESSLKQAIFTLRKALNGDNDNTQYIITAPGRGYSFSSVVEQIAPGASNHAKAQFEAPAHDGSADTAAAATESSATLPPILPPAKAPWRWPPAIPIQLGAFAILVAGIAAVVWQLNVLLVQRNTLAPEMAGRMPPAFQAAFNPPPHSVAVLAFTNMSGDAGQEYLADGLSEELINELSNVATLHVAARTSAFFFKTHPATVADIAQRLNVGAVLEGSVRRDGRRLRITTQMIDAVSGYQFWSHSYDRDFGGILKLETEIAGDVTRSLQVTLQAGDAARLTMGGTQNGAALDAFLRGIRDMNGRDEASYRAALAEFDQAVRLDPGYAAAQVRRAYTLMFVTNLAPTSTVAQMQGTMALAFGAANRAVELAPNWGVAHAARGAILLQQLELAGAEREFAQAIVLAPSDTGVDRSYAFQEAYFGHCAAAEASSSRVVSRYPLEAESYEDQAQVLYLCRRFEDLLAALRHVGALIAALPSWDQLYFALDYLAEGKPEAARESCAANRNEQQTLCLAIIMHQLGRQPEAMAYLAALRKAEGDADSYQYAEIYAQWGDRNNALAWLATAYKVRDTGLVTMKADPLLDPIRATPEFAAMERQLGFPP